MLTNAECRDNATLCLEAMRSSSAPEVREALRSMAQRWMELAERAERRSRAA
jgi:hypothetical protein